MSKLLLKTLSDQMPIEVELTQVSAGRPGTYSFMCGERHSEVEIESVGPDHGLIRSRGRVTPFYITRHKHRVDVWVRGKVYRIEKAQVATGRSAGGAVVHSSVLTAPMPGTVLRIEAEAGQRFEAHDPLLIIESMKMETTLSLPHAGKVREIMCKEGELVEMGAVLVQLEGDQDEG